VRSRIDRGSPVPLYEQIAGALRWMIATGELRRGDPLEPTREAASLWGVNRHTVRQAYQRLVQQGLAEVIPPHRFRVIEGGKARSADGEPRPVITFLEEVLRTGEERLGLKGPELLAALEKTVAARYYGNRVTVVECNRTQAEDHGRQLAEVWNVRPVPFVLGSDEELPPGPIVATFFHVEELASRWPERQNDVRYLAVRPDVALRYEAEALPWPPGRRSITVVGESSTEEARNLSSDLMELFPPDAYDHHLAIRSSWQDREGDGPPEGVTLVAPRAWDFLRAAERELPSVLCVRYRVEPEDLRSVGEHFGWERMSHAAV